MNLPTKAATLILLSVLTAGAIAAPPKTTSVPPKSAALVAADKLYETKHWREAEQAYVQYARSANDASKYEAQLKTALCMVNRKEASRAIPTLTQLVNSPSVERDAPDILALAYTQLYDIYLGQKNAAPQRERLVTECVRKLPHHETAARLCEKESIIWLMSSNTSKTIGYLKAGGNGISERGVAMLALLSSREAVSDADITALSQIANTKAVSWKSSPVSSGGTTSPSTVTESNAGLMSALCHALSTRPEGWKVEFFLASYYVEADKTSEALATLDTMLKSGHGPPERLELFRAETLAFRANRADEALNAYQAWLAAHPSSTLHEKALYQYAQLLHTCGRYVEAIALIEQQISQHPNSPYAKEGAEILTRSKAALVAKVKQAKENEKQATSLRNHAVNPGVLALENALLRGEKLIGEKKYALAAKEFQGFRGREADSKWGRGWFGFGTCLRETGDSVGAVRVWNEIWKRSLLFTNTLYGIESRYAMGTVNLEDFADATSALVCFEDVAKFAPSRTKSAKFQMNMAICHLALGHANESRRIFGDLKASFAKDKFQESYFDGLIALSDQSPFQLVKTSSALDRRAVSRLLLGDTYFVARENTKARRQYELAMNAINDPEMAAYCEMQAIRCTVALGGVDKALRDYDRFIVKFSKSSYADDVLLRTGVLWAGPKNNLKEAAKCFERITREYSSGDQAECAAFYCATIAWWDKRWNDAEKLFNDFLAKYPNAQSKTLICDSLLPAIANKKQSINSPADDAPTL